MKRPSKACIVCGRPVRRWSEDIEVKPLSARGFSSTAQVHADLRTLADCKRHTNQPHVLSAMRMGGLIVRFTVWDGESYYLQGYFCTNRCATEQGFASAQNGHRYTWKRPSPDARA